MTFQRAEHGDLRGVDALMSQLSGSLAPEDRAWQLALGAVRWAFDPMRAAAPAVADARRLAEGAAAEALVQVCALMERVSFVTLDGARLAEWIQLHASVAGASEDLPLAAARLWQRLLAAETADLDAAARALGEHASRQSAASIVIETTVIRALAALADGRLDDAVDLGRRASRMAQTEALSHHEYLANLTLARIRRYSGRPHLALHILAALDRVAPATWAGWIGWETSLAGGVRSSRATLDVPSARAEDALRAVLDAARRGDRTRFDSAATEALRAAQVWPAWGAEVTALVAALDPTRPPVPGAMTDWMFGATAAIPFGLHGVGISQKTEPDDARDPQAETATACVLARPGQRGRRFLMPGLAMAPRARLLARDSARSGARTETGIAALALAGEEGDTRDGFFRSVYGFPFVPYRHRAVLDTLCHRMRALLGEAGDVRREDAEVAAPADSTQPPASGASIALVLREPVVVPDMRCVLPTADRVLRSLAVLGATSASAAAESLRMPLRTVQAVLQQLVAEGACTIERDGRRVAYRIEDTTFTEVTVA